MTNLSTTTDSSTATVTSNSPTQQSTHKPILVVETNSQMIEDYLNSIQGRSYASVLNVGNILQVSSEAEKWLDEASIAETNRPGAVFKFRPAGPKYKAYSYKQTGTSFDLLRTAKGWVLSNATRVQIWPQQKEIRQLFLNQKQQALVLKQLMKKYQMSAQEVAAAIA